MKSMTIQQFLSQPAAKPKNMAIALLGPIETIKEASENIKEFTTATKDFFVGIGKVFYYISHPAQLGMLIWGGLVKYSLPICLMICILALLLYLMGHDKAKKFIAGSFFGYFVIQMISSAL
jgi:hypothetical protein